MTDEKELVQIFAIFFKPSLFVLAMVNDLSVNRFLLVASKELLQKSRAIENKSRTTAGLDHLMQTRYTFIGLSDELCRPLKHIAKKNKVEKK